MHHSKTNLHQVLDIQNVTSSFLSGFNSNNQASSTYSHNYDLSRDFNAINELLKPYDFVNQVIPIVFRVTGAEFMDVQALGPNATATTSPYVV